MYILFFNLRYKLLDENTNIGKLNRLVYLIILSIKDMHI